jgi:hypothetical protein
MVICCRQPSLHLSAFGGTEEYESHEKRNPMLRSPSPVMRSPVSRCPPATCFMITTPSLLFALPVALFNPESVPLYFLCFRD